MYNDRKIGKKAWLLSGSAIKGLRLESREEYTIKAIKGARECRDICEHIVLEDKDGNLIETQEYNVVITPSEGIGRYLSDNDCFVSEAYNDSVGNVAVAIEWGDWKHEHLWCRDLMGYIGYKEINEEVTEEDGSDCYSATHYFLKVA